MKSREREGQTRELSEVFVSAVNKSSHSTSHSSHFLRMSLSCVHLETLCPCQVSPTQDVTTCASCVTMQMGTRLHIQETALDLL